MFSQGAWRLAQISTTHDGNRSPQAALALAASVLHMQCVSTTGACKGVVTMPALKGYEHGEVLMWRRGGDVSEIIHFTPVGKDLVCPFPAKSLANELQYVNEASVARQEVCFIQFLSVDGSK